MAGVQNAQVADVVFSASQWLQLVGLGGAFGALGQGVRTIVGLKKLHDATSGQDTALSSAVAVDRLLISLAIGFVAGALAAGGIITDLSEVSTQQVFALAAAGYAGADFIEGFVSRVAPARDLPAGQEGIGVATPSPNTSPTPGAEDGAVG